MANLVKRYGDLLSGSTANKLKKEVAIRGNIVGNIDKKIGETRKAIGKSDMARGSQEFGDALKSLGKLKGAKSSSVGKFEDATKKLNKERLKVTGARVGTAGAIGGGALALSNKNNDKTASDIVNESFDKIAGVKEIGNKIKKGVKRYGNLVTGKSVKAKVKGQDKAYDRFYRLKTNFDVAKQSSKTGKDYLKYRNLEKKTLGKMQKEIDLSNKDVNKELVKTTLARIPVAYGAGNAIGAGLNKITEGKQNKMNEKTAFEVINEAFDKIAFKMEDMLSDADLAKLNSMKNKRTINKAPMNGPLRRKKTAFNGKMSYDKAPSPSLEDIAAITKGKKMSGKTKLAIGAGALAGLGGATYGASKLMKKKKQEKTASSIVEESFIKVAESLR